MYLSARTETVHGKVLLVVGNLCCTWESSAPKVPRLTSPGCCPLFVDAGRGRRRKQSSVQSLKKERKKVSSSASCLNVIMSDDFLICAFPSNCSSHLMFGVPLCTRNEYLSGSPF